MRILIPALLLLLLLPLAACRTRRCCLQPCQGGSFRPLETASEPPAARVFEVVAPDTVPEPSPSTVVWTTRVAQLAVEDAPMDDVLTALTMMTGMKLGVAEPARAAVEPIRVSLSVKDVALNDVLDLLTEPWALKWIAQGDAVEIVDPKADKSVIVEIHSFADLAKILEPEDLLRDVKAKLDPEQWDAEKHALALQGTSTLVVRTTRYMQDQVAEVLDDMRRTQQPTFLRFYDVKDFGDAEKLGSSIRRTYLGRDAGHTLTVQNGILIVRAPRLVLQEIDAYLAALRASRK